MLRAQTGHDIGATRLDDLAVRLLQAASRLAQQLRTFLGGDYVTVWCGWEDSEMRRVRQLLAAHAIPSQVASVYTNAGELSFASVGIQVQVPRRHASRARVALGQEF